MSDQPRSWWTWLAVDPVVRPLARSLAPHRHVTPNRVTTLATLLGLAAAACFLSGYVRWGGALVVLRYTVDCLDGTLARIQGTSTQRGALYDIASDVVSIHLAAAALTWHLVSTGDLPVGVALATLGAVAIYNWALSHRKHLAERAGLGSGGSAHAWSTDLPVVRSWVAWCRRVDVSVVPWAVEAEMLLLGLGPLLLPHRLLPHVVVLALGFYLLASMVNLARLRRIAVHLDRLATAPPALAERSTP